ncbi:MAG: hypothetical protein GKR90_05830 [Pseudomonadales bacterium]|nr:hypothetical protein [Pseudomonadales bacterium]
MASRIDPAWWSFEKSLSDTIEQELAKPKHRERWKYTRSTKALELVPNPVDHGTVSVAPGIDLDAQLVNAPEALTPFLHGQELTTKVMRDGESLALEDLSGPLLINVAANATVSITRSEVQSSSFIWIDVQDGAQAQISFNSLDHTALWDNLNIVIRKDAEVSLDLHHLGSPLCRQDIQVRCVASGANVTISSAASVLPGMHLDQQVTVQHQAPNTSSQQRFHTTGSDKSKITFNGRIHIHKDCPGVSAHLSNKNLALSDSAVINTKPELEIYTDDVACSHGATVGALASAELFYCTSRGITPERAKQMLSLAFLNIASTGPLSDAAIEQFKRALA